MTNAEIQVGEYVRTKYGYIAKVTEIGHITWFDGTVFVVSGILRYEMNKEEIDNVIVKHSFNLIDLIEVGDYVNGQRVISIEDGLIDIGQEEDYIWLGEEDIKTIVTHEQMKSIEYRVGGEDE